MIRGRRMTKAHLLLVGLGLLVAACAAEPDYGTPAYAYEYGYPYPIDGWLDFDYFGGWGGRHHDWAHWDHGHWAGWNHGWHHGPWGHGGAWGHGFAGHPGFVGHGGLGGHARG